MSDYVQNLWQDNVDRNEQHGKVGRVLTWVLAIAVPISLAAYFLRDYWYPYLSPYLYQ